MGKRKYDANDYEYMSSLSEAILQKTPNASNKLIWLVAIGIAWLIYWASIAQIDERTIGIGKVIPSQQLQVVQNLEGGVVTAILVKEGDHVKKGQILLKINDTNFASSYEESKLRFIELKAKSLRLEAEANNRKFITPKKLSDSLRKQIIYEQSLYRTDQEQLNKKKQIFSEQIKQKKNAIIELKAKISHLKESLNLMNQEMKIEEPLVKKGIISQVEFLQLRRQANNLKGDLQAAQLSLPRIKSSISEIMRKKSEVTLEFKNKAKKELNKTVAEMSRLSEAQNSLKDKVKRTFVRAPTDGTVKRLLINTVSGVVKPGMDILEIVPTDDSLLIEAKIKPRDVAYLRPGLEAMVKFTAYDFSIYGGLKGKLTFISADTITDKKGRSFYKVYIKTDKNYLNYRNHHLKIKVGMTASVDILTGKKTVLDYILKPILKAKQNALRER